MRSAWLYVAVSVAGLVLVAAMPVSPALAAADTRQARIVAAALCVAAAAASGLSKGGRSRSWTAVAGLAALAAITLLFEHVGATATCVTTYNGRPVLIGREYTPVGADYASKNPGLSASDFLLDAGGVSERIWTSSSIASCRFWTGWGGLLAVPLFVTVLCALVARRPYRIRPSDQPAEPRAVRPGQPAVFDAFISYRHGEPDSSYAEEILGALEDKGFRVAIDFRDFAPNQHFLSEMERCITTSRFVLCVVTSRFLESGHTSEEALISKTLDMTERKMRLVPLIFEAVELPVWLHGFVGIDFRSTARVDPIERLIELVSRNQVAVIPAAEARSKMPADHDS
jgi:hypothetical protein